MTSKYAKSAEEVLKECEVALLSIVKCKFGNYKCTPNDSDFDLVKKALYSLYEFRKLRNITFWEK